MKKIFFFLTLFSFGSLANELPRNTPEKELLVAEIQPDTIKIQPKTEITFNEEQLLQNQQLTERLLNDATAGNNAILIEKLLKIYRTFAQKDEILVYFAQAQIARLKGDYPKAIEQYRQILAERPDLNPVRVELAIALFENKQNDVALEQFHKAQSVENLPPQVIQQIQRYINALQKRNEWQFSAAMYYLQENNVNNASKEKYIENTVLQGLQKNDSMLPQKARGFGYYLQAAKDFNLTGNHYVSFNNVFWGKSYWDKHDYDDMLNRTSLGYSNKSAVQSWAVLPFYEKRWNGNHRYQWQSGVRFNIERWLNPNWQISVAAEYAKQRFYSSPALNGFNQLVSTTLLWQLNPQQYVYFGSDIYREKTAVKQYSYNRFGIRFGWGKEWNWGISSRLNFNFSKREYKGQAKIGIFPIGKIREDKIYSTTLTLWKRDWHLWKITPKLQFRWYKQDSNIPSLYSYTDKTANVIFETSF